MADTSPYPDDREGQRAGHGDDTGSTPGQQNESDGPEASGIDMEPNDVTSLTTPPAGHSEDPDDEFGDEEFGDEFDTESDDDDEAGGEDDDLDDMAGLPDSDMFLESGEPELNASEGDDEMEDATESGIDAEPNDTDSQFLPPDDADEDFGSFSDDFDDDEEGEDEEALLLDEPNDSDSQIAAEQITGVISFVGVPIGNRDDITFRGHRTLQMADVVVCEEFKSAARLLRNYNISKKLLEMNERNEETVSEEVLGLLRRGKSIAVIADAGLPMLADPGGILATKLRKIGVEPKIIPGVSSVMVGLMASGFGMENFDFVGVLSRRPEDRRRALDDLASRDRTIVMLEAPFRLRSLLAALAEVMPGRRAALTVNLTTPFETVIRGTIAELNARFSQKRFKGELVLVLDRLQPTQLGRGMSTVELDPEENIPEDAGMEGEFVADVDGGAKPFRRTPRTAPPGRDTGDERPPRREGDRFGSRPQRSPGGDRSAGGGGPRREGSRDGGDRRSSGGWGREGGERRSSGGWGREGGERRSGGAGAGGGWNREGGERRSGGAGAGGGWSREGGERRSSGGAGGGERRSSGGGGGWNREGGERRSGGGAGGGGGWNRGGGERRSGGGGGGWNREGGERRSGGGGGGWGREGGERRSGGGGGGWGREGGERKGGGGGWGGERKGGGGAGRGRSGPGGSRGFGPRGGGRS